MLDPFVWGSVLAGGWRVECRRICNWEKCVGVNLGRVPGVKFAEGPENGKLLWWAFGDGPGSLLGGKGGGELSRGGKTGASGACFAWKNIVW